MTKLNKTLLFLNLAFIAAIIAVGAVLAWTGPSASPPNGSGLFYYLGGNIGVGTQAPGYKFDVQGGQINAAGGLCIGGDCKTTWPAGGGSGSSLWATSSNNSIYNTNSGNVGIGTTSPGAKLDVAGGIKLANDTAACTSSNAGTMRWTGTNLEFCQDNSWKKINITAYVNATGGTITEAGGYRIHTFTSSGTFHVITGGDVDYLVVAGGGGGGGTWDGRAGGGGGGGMRTDTLNLTAGDKTVTVGAGGQGGVLNTSEAANGADSVFSSITSIGGGKGGSPAYTRAGGSGGSGGGGGAYNSVGGGGSGTVGQGNNGGGGTANYGAGGGGGAGGAGGTAPSGTVGGNGGAGAVSDISGVATYYAGGGGGSGTVTQGTGGIGGGGNATANGAVNTGGGGGGDGGTGYGGAGGSGIVIIKYPIPS